MSFEIPVDEELRATLATQFFGVTFASMLYGVTCIQTFQYFQSTKAQSDRPILKATVLAFLFLDSLHEAFILHIVYSFQVGGFADRLGLLHNVWSIGASLIANALIAYGVQSYLIIRIWRISHNKYVAGVCGLLSIAQLVTGLAKCIQELTYVNVIVAEAKVKHISIVELSLTMTVDLLIATALSSYLQKSRTGFHRSDDLITKLMLMTVTTGTLTSLFAIAELSAYLAAPDQTYVLVISFSLGKRGHIPFRPLVKRYPNTLAVYVNCFLTTLNSREYLLKLLEPTTININSVPLSRIQTNAEGTARSSRPGQGDYAVQSRVTSTPTTLQSGGKHDSVVILAPPFSLSVTDLEAAEKSYRI
ncbi:hypothetical protein FA95DRAFT_1611163 [Auriscalpium vulgare]|uniref:Uncharacterized protein n=1 Tax=Auriscalpium vulgare TaxID=40419 RepID=A0ACB8RB43_9AGAM|nr:hypothetical protein FA95DRAFT_1611163 [Auriscalpium vulgare]